VFELKRRIQGRSIVQYGRVRREVMPVVDSNNMVDPRMEEVLRPVHPVHDSTRSEKRENDACQKYKPVPRDSKCRRAHPPYHGGNIDKRVDFEMKGNGNLRV